MIDFTILPGAIDDIPDPLPPARDWNRAHLCTPETIAAQKAGDTPRRFNLLSLPAWLAVADRAGVPFIPAREIATLPIEEFTLEPAGEDEPTVGFEAAIVDALGENELVRFEQVAPAEIKHEMSEGQALGNGTFWSDPLGRRMVPLYEDRFYQ